MLNLCKSKLIHNLNSRSLLLAIVVFIFLAGTAVTMPGHSKASGGPSQSRSGSITANPSPIPVSDGSGMDVTTTSRASTGTSAVNVQADSSVSQILSRATQGEFGPVIHLPLVPVHLSVLPDGRVLFWGRDKGIAANGDVKDVAGKSEAYVWNIADGSNKTDVAVFRPSNGIWQIINSSNDSTRTVPWGVSGDVPVPGDYDGDGKADIALFRPSNGAWYIINSSTGATSLIPWGLSADIAAPGDYDGDGKTDIAIFRPSEGNWYIRKSSDGSLQLTSWGTSGDIPVPKDYDLDRKTDLAVFRPSNGIWYILSSSTGSTQVTPWGGTGDVPVPGDYNDDGRADIAIFRPSENNWYIRNSFDGSFQIIPWGGMGDVPVPGDYDGDRKTDIAIFRPSEGYWYIRKSSDGSLQMRNLGASGDILVPADYDGMLRVANSTTNLFCSGHSFLPDGRLFVAGGHKSPDFDGVGENHTNIFDYTTNSWSRGPYMNEGRWYPYNVTLNTGATLIMSGTYLSSDPNYPPNTLVKNLVPQVYTTGSGFRNLNEPESLIYYPFLHLTPNGGVLQIQAGFVDINANRLIDLGSRLLDPDTNQWTNQGDVKFAHANGTSVLFDNGRKVLLVGGVNATNTPTVEAEFADLKPAQGQPLTWTSVKQMQVPRRYPTATILPDGKVLVSGGISCQGFNSIVCSAAAAMIPEMWDATAFDPNNPTSITSIPWVQMASQKEVRAYHSIAALLPDGRVLIGGGGLPGAIGEIDANGQRITNFEDNHAKLFGHKNVEIYSPPYLFDSNGNLAARPSITSAPTSVSYDQTFFVGTSGAGTSTKVSLVRLPSVTHGFIQDQRHIFLTATLNGTSGLNVTAPPDSNKCPPGYYMLFVLNSNGVPSVSKIIRVLDTPAYEGFLDGSDCNQIWGWAWDRAKPNKPINVDIYSGSTYIATVAANLFRQDLLNADKGNGLHAFVFNVPASLKNGQDQSITVRFAGTSTSLIWSPRSIICRAVMFPSPTGTISVISAGGSTWEQATKFFSSVSGKITHIRFYKASGETGTHTGRIWSETGVLLAQVTFTNETASGWQEVALQTPLQITAGVRYRVSYNVNSFRARIQNGLTQTITNGPLTALSGFFATPAGTFPNTGSADNFLADIVFNSPQ